MAASLGECPSCFCDVHVGVSAAPDGDRAPHPFCDCRCHHNWRFIHRHPATTGDPT